MNGGERHVNVRFWELWIFLSFGFVFIKAETFIATTKKRILFPSKLRISSIKSPSSSLTVYSFLRLPPFFKLSIHSVSISFKQQHQHPTSNTSPILPQKQSEAIHSLSRIQMFFYIGLSSPKFKVYCVRGYGFHFHPAHSLQDSHFHLNQNLPTL